MKTDSEKFKKIGGESNKMTFGKFLPVALMIGASAGLFVYVGALLGIVLWVPFFSWAMFFAVGPNHSVRMKRLPKDVVALVGGTAFAVAFIALIPVLTKMGLTFPVTGAILAFLAATIIVLLELTSLWEYAPGYFISFAGYFAYAFGAGTAAKLGAYDSKNALMSFVYFSALLISGFILGVITSWLREAILNAEGVPIEQQQTVFDKEQKAT